MYRVFGALCIVLLAAGSASAAAPVDPREAARAILKGDRYQTELPSTPPSSAPEILPRPRMRGMEDAEPVTFVPPMPSRGITIAVLVLIVGAGLALLLRSLPRSAAVPGQEAPAPGRPDRPVRPRAVDDPEALAHQGRFAEAIHALLLRALVELGRDRRGSPAASPASTSREVLRSTTLGPDAKAALAPLVAAVEWVHFGHGRAGAEEYASCAAHYRRFKDACRATG